MMSVPASAQSHCRGHSHHKVTSSIRIVHCFTPTCLLMQDTCTPLNETRLSASHPNPSWPTLKLLLLKILTGQKVLLLLPVPISQWNLGLSLGAEWILSSEKSPAPVLPHTKTLRSLLSTEWRLEECPPFRKHYHTQRAGEDTPPLHALRNIWARNHALLPVIHV